MKIKMSYDAKADIPAGMADLYTETDGKFLLTGVEGMKTEADVGTVRTSLVAERASHKKTKDELNVIRTALGDLKPEDVAAKIDLVDELQAQVDANKDGKGKDNDAVDRIVETRVKRALAPVERERDQLKKQVTDLTGERDALGGTLKKGKIEDAVRKAATDSKVIATALEDVLLNAGNVFELTEDGKVVAKDGVGVTPGLTPDVWLKDMQDKRPQWWPLSQGSGANGSQGGKSTVGNPWSAANWNMTEQGNFLRLHGAEKASNLAAQAGVKVGAVKPAAVAK